MLDNTAQQTASLSQDEQAPNDNPTTDFLPLKLMKAAQGIQLAFTRQLGEDLDIGIAEWRLLTALDNQTDIAANEVAAIAGMDKVQVSRAVSRALGHRLVSRRRDQEDRRRTVLNLTDEGKKVVEASKPLAKKFDTALREKLGISGVAELEQQLNTLNKIAEQWLER